MMMMMMMIVLRGKDGEREETEGVMVSRMCSAVVSVLEWESEDRKARGGKEEESTILTLLRMG